MKGNVKMVGTETDHGEEESGVSGLENLSKIPQLHHTDQCHSYLLRLGINYGLHGKYVW